MNLLLSAYNFDILEATISANAVSGLTWECYYLETVTVQGTAATQVTLNPFAASATYFYIPSSTVIWSTSSDILSTGIINLTAFADNVSLIINVSDFGTPTNIPTSIQFNPFYSTQDIISSNQLGAAVSAQYIQSTTNITQNYPLSTELLWTITPRRSDTIVTFADGSTVFDLTTAGVISGTSPAATAVSFLYTGSSLDLEFNVGVQVINDKYNLSPISELFYKYQPSSIFTLNPQVRAQIEDTEPSYAILSAVQTKIVVPSSMPLNWNTDDNTNMKILTGSSLNTIYTPGYTNTGLNRILISAIDLSKTYDYTLSAFTGEYTSTFRPYDTVTEASLLTVRTNNLPNEENIYKYEFQSLGFTNNRYHLISPFQYLVWSCNNTDAAFARYIDDITPYTFDTVNGSTNIDNLYIRIVPPVVTSTPQICTISFQVCALQSALIADGIYNAYTFDIVYNEWLSNSVFNPGFRFQYEPENQTTIYRPANVSTVYTISNTSILPPDSFGVIQYTFNTGVCSVPFDIRNNTPAPTGVTYEFETLSEPTCTITMVVCASAAGFLNILPRYAAEKQIVFANIPSVSSFCVYPEWQWDGVSAWNSVVSSYPNQGDILLPTAPLSAYSVCHTENFFLSASDTTGSQYWWSVQSIEDDTIQKSTYAAAPTAWLPVKTGPNSASLSVCAAIFTDRLSADMPSMYYDTPVGVRFSNFATTFDLLTSDHKQHIRLVGINDLGVKASLSAINYVEMPVPNTLVVGGEYNSLDSNSLFTASIDTFYFDLSSEFWNERAVVKTPINNIATLEVDINVDDIANSYLGVPQNESTKIVVTPGLQYTLAYKVAHPSNNDWCLTNISARDVLGSTMITAFPMMPVIYNPNRFILTGTNVKFENLVQCFPNANSIFTWTDRRFTNVKTTCAPYITTFGDIGGYDITLTNQYYLGGLQKTVENSFSNIVTVQNQYIPFDTNISRIFENTRLTLPYSREDCFMAPNEFVVKDTFNAMIKKLQTNLDYIEYMSQLYDVPPTDYIGWFGSTYYNNSAIRTRWFTNTPHNSFSYDQPENAIENRFHNLQSCFVRDNIMYVSDNTSVSIISGDFWGTTLGTRTYKTLGDDFISIHSIKLDSDGRIYLLDSYDTNDASVGSKNRVVVFSFDFDTRQWRLMYEWGGLGGYTAKNKFNNPSDLYVDEDDILWVSDTGNKCIKKYTKTGSWLATILSEHFTNDERPISVAKDTDKNLYVLTQNQIVKFDIDGNFVAKYAVEKGATRLKNCRDGGFIYVVYSSKIVKLTTDGKSAGVIAESDFPLYNKDYRNVFHDEYRNLYIINKTNILKYIDQLSITSLKLDTSSKMWPIDSLLVQKDEYIQDWVINRCIQRFWDNLEIFRQSLIGKFGYQTIKNVVTTSYVQAQTAPIDFDYCNYDWLHDIGRLITSDITYTYEKPVIKSFKPSEYKQLPYRKETVYVGLNELSSAEVYNRVIAKLYECQNTILQMISD